VVVLISSIRNTAFSLTIDIKKNDKRLRQLASTFFRILEEQPYEEAEDKTLFRNWRTGSS